ncbi:siderophore iron transporter mirb [Stemphylium lycopersici]|uniref:Siderophore iron transporter mirb n=1 Tax=Stemphylium lycopersici TaxID=183478 RepID=A0A364MW09_STELY|nr:siderophore iron transporter mirb [Stemphylium lycopersici]
MASGFAPQMEKLSGMHLGEQHEFASGDETIVGSAKQSTTDKYGSQVTMETPRESNSIDAEQPKGPAEMEAVTIVWTRNWLIAAYSAIMLISFVNSLQQQANFTWKPFVTSTFMKHGLTAMTDIVANIVGGVSKLPLAKFIDLVGRPQGFLVCLVCIVASLILMAACQNVQTFCAAQVIYWTGMNGVDYVFNIFIADTSLMKNRLIWMAFTGLPYVVNTFAGPKLGETFLNHSGWRWGYGTFAILTPVFSLSFWAVFWIMGRRAKKMGVLKREKSGRTLFESTKHWCIEFDVVGLLLVCGGFSLLLLPFPLAAYQKDRFASAMVICMITFGIILLGLFIAWERFGARKTFFPFYLMKNRCVIASCLLGCNSWIAFYSYRMMYSSYLQVVFQLDVAKAGYINNIFSIVSCTWAIVISFAMKYTDTYKWGAIVAVPTQLLMTGLLIHLRTPGSSIALLVMIEVFGAMASAMLYNVEQVAIMIAVPHEELAVSIALLNVMTAVGGAIGQSISSTLWAQIVPRKIAQYLPAASADQIASLYGNINNQLAAKWGTPEREAVVMAFADAQKVMVIFGTCALVPCLVWVAMLKNSRMSEQKARKGLQA